jgi:hypothetical protein
MKNTYVIAILKSFQLGSQEDIKIIEDINLLKKEGVSERLD